MSWHAMPTLVSTCQVSSNRAGWAQQHCRSGKACQGLRESFGDWCHQGSTLWCGMSIELLSRWHHAATVLSLALNPGLQYQVQLSNLLVASHSVVPGT